MDTQTLEFNTIRTVGTINKDSMLKRVYEKKLGEHNHAKLKEQAVNNKLADETIDFLKSVFVDVILQKPELIDAYNKVELSTKTPRRYGKVQITNDILAQGGVPSKLQTASLNVSDLKTITLNIAAKLTSDHYRGTKNFSSDDLKDINALIRDFKKKSELILNKK